MSGGGRGGRGRGSGKAQVVKNLSLKNQNPLGVSRIERAKELLPPLEDLLPRGKSKRISCPFPDHPDENPSCHVYDDHFWCYSCDRGGDSLDAYAIKHGLTIKQALDQLVPAAPTQPVPAPSKEDIAFRRLLKENLSARPNFVAEWAIAKDLALLPENLFIADICSTPFRRLCEKHGLDRVFIHDLVCAIKEAAA